MYLCSSLHFEHLKSVLDWKYVGFETDQPSAHKPLGIYYSNTFNSNSMIFQNILGNHSASSTCSSKPQAVAGRRSSHLPVLPMKPSHKRPQWMA